jgi:hypothetical protein
MTTTIAEALETRENLIRDIKDSKDLFGDKEAKDQLN